MNKVMQIVYDRAVRGNDHAVADTNKGKLELWLLLCQRGFKTYYSKKWYLNSRPISGGALATMNNMEIVQRGNVND